MEYTMRKLFSILILLTFVSLANAESYIINYSKAIELCSKLCKKKDLEIIWIVNTIKYYSTQAGVNPNTILALAISESNLNPKAIGPGKYSKGIMQVNTRYHMSKFNKSPLDLEDNVRVGVSIYRDCVQRHNGNFEKSIYCYRGITDSPYLSKIKKFKSQAVFQAI